MAVYAYEDINTVLGSRLQKTIMTTIHVKDVPYGEIDPFFAHKYSDELDDEWKVYGCKHLIVLGWNRDLEKPLITTGWTALGPVAEPVLAEIIQMPGPNGVKKLEYLAWHKLCIENMFSGGEILKFTFFDIENSNRVDVDRVNP
ncbi:hypothetical protein TSUD_291600 [Trifolium subterraneum]|uniref:Uncharacterized protein n=1 Tax=Trifolium subterraneum TaxID=3900 RepID=A0A2Z6PHG0_TRISU|nr:hypothetical protein TSUD_291600 [Trifolium subterraneum]